MEMMRMRMRMRMVLRLMLMMKQQFLSVEFSSVLLSMLHTAFLIAPCDSNNQNYIHY